MTYENENLINHTPTVDYTSKLDIKNWTNFYSVNYNSFI